MDEIDAKILNTLLGEPRTSFTELSKDCKITVQAVRSRYERMKKNGIINGAIMQVNPKNLGFDCCGVLVITTESGKEDEVRDYFKTKDCVVNDYGYASNMNMVKIVGLRDVESFVKVVDELKARPYVKSVEPSIWIDQTNMVHPENLIVAPYKESEMKIQTEKTTQADLPERQITPSPHRDLDNQNFKEIQIDEIDWKIVKIISQNARISFSKIAKQVGIATNSVIKRYKKLRKNNVLHLSSIQVNLEKLGYKAMAVLSLKVSKGSNTSKIYEQMVQMPNVIITIRTLGLHDLMITVPLTEFEQLFKLKNTISKIPGIEKIAVEIHMPYRKWPINKFASVL